MQLSRADALFLSKILFYHSRITSHEESSPMSSFLETFLARVDEFLAGGELRVAGPLSGEEDDDDEEDDEEEEGEEEEGEEEEGDPPPRADEKISAADLHDMTAIEVECDGTTALLEFEEVDGGVDVLFSNSTFEGVSVLRRTGKTLEIWAEGEDEDWQGTFEIKKLSKTWKTLLKDGVVYEVA